MTMNDKNKPFCFVVYSPRFDIAYVTKSTQRALGEICVLIDLCTVNVIL